MRALTLTAVSALLLGGVSSSFAADLDSDFLRGSETDYEPAPSYIDWSGVYVGGHAGYTTSSVDYDKAGRTDVARILAHLAVESEFAVSDWSHLRPDRGHGASFGGFGGYNFQIDDVVLGIEADYTSSFQKTRSNGFIERSMVLDSGRIANVSINVNSSATLKDYSTLRIRAGYSIGSFLPFMTAGVAFGRAEVGNTVNVRLLEYANATNPRPDGGLLASGGGSKEKYALGFALGGGVASSITQNIFLRGEYQYVQFDEFGDHRIHASTVRGALGVKF